MGMRIEMYLRKSSAIVETEILAPAIPVLIDPTLPKAGFVGRHRREFPSPGAAQGSNGSYGRRNLRVSQSLGRR